MEFLSAICGLAGLVCSILILIDAFGNDVTKGLLCMCVPFYIFYFAFAEFENPHKPVILGIWFGGGVFMNVFALL